MGSPVSHVMANIFMEYVESLAIPLSPTSGGSGMLIMSTVPPGKIKLTNFRSLSIP